MSYDRQCSSCGGFCGRGGCKRENVSSWEQRQRMATPHDQLIAELLDSRIPKTEREHAAAREIKKLREALAEPEPKPVVWIRHENEWVGLAPKERLPIETPRPDARKPLTDDELLSIWRMRDYRGYSFEFARAIERAHGIGE